jgi:hypothetical protein
MLAYLIPSGEKPETSRADTTTASPGRTRDEMEHLEKTRAWTDTLVAGRIFAAGVTT